jgi:hypothetical protein
VGRLSPTSALFVLAFAVSLLAVLFFVTFLLRFVLAFLPLILGLLRVLLVIFASACAVAFSAQQTRHVALPKLTVHSSGIEGNAKELAHAAG